MVKLAVIIPCYRVSRYIENVLRTIPSMVHTIIVIDDACPEQSWQVAESLKKIDPRIQIVRHSENQGVGGAMITGYEQALKSDCDIFIKMDGDGQMDPKYIESLVRPLINNCADYCKGNRFREFNSLQSMPKLRLFGNSVLSFVVKAASGYWNIMDPTNGYTAIHRRILEKMDLTKLSRRYFFESDMLIQLNILSAVATDVPMKSRYADEESSLNIPTVILQFPTKLARGLVRRLFLKYFIYDFNMASVYFLIGIPLLSFGLVFGILEWFDSFLTGKTKSAGTIMVAALPIILAFQMLLQAIQIDIDKTPKK